jgi:hypothetical protein
VEDGFDALPVKDELVPDAIANRFPALLNA